MLALGQVLFKKAAIAPTQGYLDLFLSWPFILALAIYGISTLVYGVLLQSAPLSRAYPVILLGSAIVPLCAHYLFGESLGLKYAGGMLLIFAGLYLVVTANT